jgi:hypothetical protein
LALRVTGALTAGTVDVPVPPAPAAAAGAGLAVRARRRGLAANDESD